MNAVKALKPRLAECYSPYKIVSWLSLPLGGFYNEAQK